MQSLRSLEAEDLQKLRRHNDVLQEQASRATVERDALRDRVSVLDAELQRERLAHEDTKRSLEERHAKIYHELSTTNADLQQQLNQMASDLHAAQERLRAVSQELGNSQHAHRQSVTQQTMELRLLSQALATGRDAFASSDRQLSDVCSAADATNALRAAQHTPPEAQLACCWSACRLSDTLAAQVGVPPPQPLALVRAAQPVHTETATLLEQLATAADDLNLSVGDSGGLDT